MDEKTNVLDQKQLLQRSENLLEPAWLRTLRRRALDLFNKQSWPERTDENWRFTDYRHLLPRSLGGNAEGADGPMLPVAELEGALGSELIEEGGKTKATRLDGVKIATTLEAARTQDAAVKAELREALAHSVDRFDALALATFVHGWVVRVDEGTHVQKPFGLRLTPQGSDNAWEGTFSVVSLGRGSKGILVLDFGDSGASRSTSGSDHLRVELQDGAEWRIVLIQEMGLSDNRLQRIRFTLGKESRLEVFRLDWGGSTVKVETSLVFRGEGSEARWFGAYLLAGTQRFELDTLQDHVVGGDMSDLLVKGVLSHYARAVFRGLIWIHSGAQRSNAYQANRNLLLSENAHVRSIPMLEIEANDVRCSHGSASGPIDPDQIFYLRSRGLREREARRMIINGFVAALLENDLPAKLNDALEQAVTTRIDQMLED